MNAGSAGSRAEPHAHGFTPVEARQARRLALVLVIAAGFFGLEFGGALVAKSVVLQAEALHLLMDVLAMGVSLVAMRVAVRRPTARFTFGLRRAEPVAAIFSAFLVLLTTVFIVVEALDALHGEGSPKAGIMLFFAVLALIVNGLSAWLLHDIIVRPHDEHDGHDGHRHDRHGHDHDRDHGDPDNPEDLPHATATAAATKAHGHALNLRGVWLHLAGDTLGALAALGAALAIRFAGLTAADPIASFLVAAILVVGSLRLLRDATLVLLESAPPHLPVGTVRAIVLGQPGVLAVHDLHVWTLGAGHDALTVHVETSSVDPRFGRDLSERLRATLGAEYVTVQVDVI